MSFFINLQLQRQSTWWIVFMNLYWSIVIKNEPTFHTEATLFTQQRFLVSESCQVRRLFELLSLNSQLILKSWAPYRPMKEVIRGVITLQLSDSWPVKGSWIIRWIFRFWVCHVTQVTETKDWLLEHHSLPERPLSPFCVMAASPLL